MIKAGAHIYLFACALMALTGCRQEMADQPRYEAYEVGPHFEDSLVMRPPVEGTVSRARSLQDAYRPQQGSSGERGRPLEDDEASGTRAAGDFPFPITQQVLERGRQRYDIYCSPCHGRDGYGRGIIVQRGLRRPPSFHTDRLRAAPPRHVYDVVTEGYGAMYSYAARVEPVDRWAIAAYIQALQLSQHAAADALPDTLRSRPSAASPEAAQQDEPPAEAN